MLKQNVLLIDDNDHQHELFRCYALTAPNIEIDHATSLEEGVECLSVRTPNVIFLDNRLQPFRNFSETVPVIREAGFQGKIIIISSDIDDPQFSNSERFSVHHCRSKSDFTLSTFQDIVESYVG